MLGVPRKMASVVVIATRKFTCYPPSPIPHRTDPRFREVHILTEATQPPVLRARVHTQSSQLLMAPLCHWHMRRTGFGQRMGERWR